VCESLNEVLIIRRVPVLKQYPALPSDERFDTPIQNDDSEVDLRDCTDADIEAVFAMWERQGLCRLSLGTTGETAWIPTPAGTLALGWKP